MFKKDEGVFSNRCPQQGRRLSENSVEKEIYTILDRLKKARFLKRELEKVKISTRASFTQLGECRRCGLFGSYLVRGDINPLLNYEKSLMRWSVEKIKEVANTYFVRDSLR